MSTSKGEFYLVLSQKEYVWQGLRARITAKKPNLAAGEISLALDVEIPTALFNRPTMRAKVRLPDNQKITDHITADVADNLADLMTERLGMRVMVSADDQESK